jgi:hypothetical protein
MASWISALSFRNLLQLRHREASMSSIAVSNEDESLRFDKFHKMCTLLGKLPSKGEPRSG